MGLGLQLFDPSFSKENQEKAHQQQNNIEKPSQSLENAQQFAYYEDLIKQYTEKHPNANDKLALALILSRGIRPTISKNRDLAMLDIDKVISMKHNTLPQDGSRMENMKLAADLTGLKNNLLIRNTIEEPQLPPIPRQNPRGNFQIFRLIRAAQMHYLNPRRERNEEAIVNNSMQRIQEE